MDKVVEMNNPVKEIQTWLTKSGSKFSLTKEDNEYYQKGQDKGKPKHLVNGYSSNVLTVYVDRHQKEVTVFTVKRNGMNPMLVLEANKSLLKHPDVLKDFIIEKQKYYERLFSHATKPRR